MKGEMKPYPQKVLKNLINLLKYHLNISFEVPIPKIILAKSALEYASLYQFGHPDKKHWLKTASDVKEINSEASSFYNNADKSIVIRDYTLVDGEEHLIPEYIPIPMDLILHELIHHIQYLTGGTGSWALFYEGWTEIMINLITGDYLDKTYRREVAVSFSLAVALSGSEINAINTIRRYHTHTKKNFYILSLLRKSKLLAGTGLKPKNFLDAVDESLDLLQFEFLQGRMKLYSFSSYRNTLERLRKTLLVNHIEVFPRRNEIYNF
ncbi:hypothetical protein JGI24_00317 [Candidatus Kryptobacter tengchongensis]|uniref:Uncharacterized protein n=2 Tax=Kryptobacter tengchongensis TaxID=1643429 RepID=A0A656D2A3_KRYT1|nr:hypothetical protein JGI24_00317 [Candidatus Kryptobacter tengchongensis]